MSDNGEFILLCIWLLFVPITIGVMLSLYRSYNKKESGMWEGIAKRTNLTLKPGRFLNRTKVDGQYRNHNVVLTTIDNRPPKLFLAVTVNNSQAVNFSLEQRGTVESFFRTKDTQIQIGDQKFDRLFLGRGSPEDKIRSILSTEGVAKRLMRANWRGYTKLKLEGNYLQLVQRYAITYDDLSEYLHHLLDLLIDIAEIIESEKVPLQEGVV
jgi:hypothetical protein